MSRYPDWVNQYKTKGTSVKKVGDSYYLYSNTSKYVKGKKYPQPIQHFIGTITPEGVVETHKKKVSLSDIEVYEYGFSYALLKLCDEKWKKNLKNEWYDVLCNIIISYSKTSYILHDSTFLDASLLHHNLQGQAEKLFSRLDIQELLTLKDIYAVYIDHKMIISKISPQHQAILDKYHLELGGAYG
ncbi:MAG: hypothetical protein RR562_10110 [Longicatena sp.]